MTNNFKALNPDYESKVRQSFVEQGIMKLMGATIRDVGPGRCIIELPFNEKLTQQDGFFHAGATSTIADSAGGYAALTLMPADSQTLTVEFKINLLVPASGDRLCAEATVIKAGKTLTVSNIEVFSHRGESRKLCAIMQQTTICIPHPD
ncbi:MAG: PaaI family thioesterase [Acidiferrobacterales bacterium]|nr:PaaI family thioesterase [Acidiferrobacterales bacterium]